MRVPSKIVFINSDVEKAFNDVEINGKLRRSLVRAFERIAENAFCGIQLPKKLIPREYTREYDIHNLWKYNLVDGWRLIYSVESDQILVLSLIIDWMPHKEYENLFHYIA